MAVLESVVQKDELFERRRERMEGLVTELRGRAALHELRTATSDR